MAEIASSELWCRSTRAIELQAVGRMRVSSTGIKFDVDDRIFLSSDGLGLLLEKLVMAGGLPTMTGAAAYLVAGDESYW